MHNSPNGKKDFLSRKPLFLERLQKLKAENNTTSEQIAEHLNMPFKYYVDNVEAPDVYVKDYIIHLIAQFFDVQLDYLYGFTNHPHDEFYDSDIFVDISRRLKKLEIINDYPDDKDIADFLEITEDEYWDIKYGKNRGTPLYVIVNLANYFNISTDYLLGRSDNPARI